MSNAKRISAGDSVPHTPGSALAAGDVVVQGSLVGIATEAIAANEVGALAVTGVFELPKNTSQAFTVGATIYWDDSADELTTTSTSNEVVGKCVEAASAAATTGKVLLDQ